MAWHTEPDNETLALIRKAVAAGESFASIAERYGCWEKDVADAVSEGRRMPWAPPQQ